MSRFLCAALLTTPLLMLFAPGQDQPTTGQLRIPDRATTALFKGKPGKQRTEIHFDRASGMVTLKLLVQDPNGYFIPNIRRDNFVVYENDVQQNNLTVDVEHPQVSLGMVLEYGGHYPALNKEIATHVAIAARQLLEVAGREDKIAIWKYADKPELLVDFTQDHQKLESILYSLEPPGVSETNLYDAVVAVLKRLQSLRGRKALILISSGVDTFSKSRLEDVLNVARTSDTSIYVIGLGEIFRQALPGTVPSATFNWKSAEQDLQEIARASAGRFYAPPNTVELSAVYDDIIESLKVRYVITYKSSTSGDLKSPRRVRVELVNPKTGGPLQVTDSSGRTIEAHVILEDSYVPANASGE